MTPAAAIELARRVKDGHAYPTKDALTGALIALLDHGDKVLCPDFETAVRVVAASMHGQGKFYIEIAIDPKTKEVAWTHTPTMPDPTRN